MITIMIVIVDLFFIVAAIVIIIRIIIVVIIVLADSESTKTLHNSLLPVVNAASVEVIRLKHMSHIIWSVDYTRILCVLLMLIYDIYSEFYISISIYVSMIKIENP